MTPGARLSAAIAVLDRVLGGEPAERALTNWGRASRFAGSGDRAAVRDLVYDALRKRASSAARGGGLTGRGLVLGLMREAGQEALFTGEGHAPAVPAPEEVERQPDAEERLDLPVWLIPELRKGLGTDTAPVAEALRSRAPVFLRVNLGKTDLAGAQASLDADGIKAVPHPLATTSLEVTGNARKVQGSTAYQEGLVELQDASSQAVVEALPLADGMKVLDHCAGGGGKTLAMAARSKLRLWAHDASPRRMTDLPERARRAGVTVERTERPEAAAPYDLVLVDAPCSGSGSWRRDPEGKWRLTPEMLEQVLTTQAAILDRVAPMVGAAGWLAYATCSLLPRENRAQVEAFLTRHPGWRLQRDHAFTPLQGGDGFYLALLQRS
ncbi:RsmB/NOP family class I SAM-dependent RNA methyltransferase [Tabrizicola sp.]|uniref:RsmB/NOP family class I SAM-dependent RNA methyltransferase n=1 Tax=Tabrizicola sp. TaxID=2005166 RepID=UPI002734AD45|nr:RsmB/NOP family class I SAM-dependent RNA methyltransferase [Tabrizicola sp.]MDP3195806.1 RsmB/NOP family class I SAM-dependent RNA methyltransferase [Tabrizicola sp.]MDZ4069403.1 RsmB/NOP family class I SAM-dependent RNA methyltransferase [Tabrizicola sp.]